MSITCQLINYHNPKEAQDLIDLLELYALDPMGGNTPLTHRVKQNLTTELAKYNNAFSMIAYVNQHPAGLANCFENFSTFQCQPLINIHDLIVSEKFRKQSIGTLLLQKIEEIAMKKNCCKITLEVLEGNQVAKNAYLKFGFSGYQLNTEMGKALFWEKKLN